MKFIYSNPWKIEYQVNLKKFRNGLVPAKEHISLTLEKYTEQNNERKDNINLFIRSL